jgi:hypothetical protein
MRIAMGLATSAAVLIGARALGVLGPWAMGTGALLVLLAAIVATTVMDRQDLKVGMKSTTAPPRQLRRAA